MQFCNSNRASQYIYLLYFGTLVYVGNGVFEAPVPNSSVSPIVCYTVVSPAVLVLLYTPFQIHIRSWHGTVSLLSVDEQLSFTTRLADLWHLRLEVALLRL